MPFIRWVEGLRQHIRDVVCAFQEQLPQAPPCRLNDRDTRMLQMRRR